MSRFARVTRRLARAAVRSATVRRLALGFAPVAVGLTSLTAEGAGPPIVPIPVVTGLDLPVGLTNAGDGSGRLFISLQRGKVLIFDGAHLLATPFLDLTALTPNPVDCCGERGFLGLAFPPDYETSGQFYVSYTDASGALVVARYAVDPNDDNLANPGSGQILLTVPHPDASNHNSGQLAFGPDGFLYIGTGDGGGGGDTNNNAQTLSRLLGKILRLDVRSAPDPGLLYKIPATNPFKNTAGARAEIWAFGLRNPWRFGFDRLSGDLFIADVGQNMWEEIDFQPAGTAGGRNYGWHILEATHCYNAATCSSAGLTPPILEYSHSLGCSVTGGYRYRGPSFAALVGVYVFADYCSGRIWGGTQNGNGSWSSSELLDSPYSITAFGEDEAGELYFTHYDSKNPVGAVYRIASNASVTALTPSPNALATPVVVNTPVTWTATASNGGAGTLEYRFWVFRNGAWSIVRDYAASNTFQWTPAAAGPYSFGVWVRHVGNSAGLEAGLGTATFQITP